MSSGVLVDKRILDNFKKKYARTCSIKDPKDRIVARRKLRDECYVFCNNFTRTVAADGGPTGKDLYDAIVYCHNEGIKLDDKRNPGMGGD